MIYPVDSVIHLLNKGGWPTLVNLILCTCLFCARYLNYQSRVFIITELNRPPGLFEMRLLKVCEWFSRVVCKPPGHFEQLHCLDVRDCHVIL